MTKQQLQQELKEKVKAGVKPSDLRKLKRSKSEGDIPKAPPLPSSVPLSRSKSQLEIPLTQPNSTEQISQLQEQVKFHAETASNYLKSLQTSQAKVSELEKRLSQTPLFPSVLIQGQLKEKQKEIESLREKLEIKNKELKTLNQEQSNLLDDNLSLKHQGLKDWFTQYQQTQKLEQELKENVDYAAEELLTQDQTISTLQKERSQLKEQNSKLKQTNQSLQKDLDLTHKLAQLRKDPLPSTPLNSS